MLAAGCKILAAQESEDVMLALQEANDLLLTQPSGIAPDMWQTLGDIFQPDDGLSEMQMEEDLHALKFVRLNRGNNDYSVRVVINL